MRDGGREGMDEGRDAERLGEKGWIDGGRKGQGGDIDVCSVAGRRRRKRVRK